MSRWSLRFLRSCAIGLFARLVACTSFETHVPDEVTTEPPLGDFSGGDASVPHEGRDVAVSAVSEKILDASARGFDADATVDLWPCLSSAGVCVIDCVGRDCSESVAHCPGNRDCRLRCGAGRPCPFLKCTVGRRCTLDCEDSAACKGVTVAIADAASLCVRCASCDSLVCSGANCTERATVDYTLGCAASCSTKRAECN